MAWPFYIPQQHIKQAVRNGYCGTSIMRVCHCNTWWLHITPVNSTSVLMRLTMPHWGENRMQQGCKWWCRLGHFYSMCSSHTRHTMSFDSSFCKQYKLKKSFESFSWISTALLCIPFHFQNWYINCLSLTVHSLSLLPVLIFFHRECHIQWVYCKGLYYALNHVVPALNNAVTFLWSSFAVNYLTYITNNVCMYSLVTSDGLIFIVCLLVMGLFLFYVCVVLMYWKTTFPSWFIKYLSLFYLSFTTCCVERSNFVLW